MMVHFSIAIKNPSTSDSPKNPIANYFNRKEPLISPSIPPSNIPKDIRTKEEENKLS